VIDPHLKVLVVDPLRTATRSVADQLREIGFLYVDQAHNGIVARERLKHDHYGLVLSEWEIDTISGLDLLKIVRADPRTKGLPFLLMTDLVQVDRVIVARQAGVSGYLVKPFSEALLKQKLMTILSGEDGVRL
jgi:two-component system chemotaxis response regulator CheY